MLESQKAVKLEILTREVEVLVYQEEGGEARIEWADERGGVLSVVRR